MQPDEILKTLEDAGYEAWLVGGCVRDKLLGRAIHDWDITTSARPEQTMALFPRCIPTGIKHGTVTVIVNDQIAEVTTFRCDGAYHDGRHPDGVQFVSNLEEDLARRDFTINAMAMNRRGELKDLYGGQRDLARGLIRCVGAPDRRFQEDALRMLRAWRFSAQLGFSIEEHTARAARQNAALCRALSRERVCEETEKVLLSPRPELLGDLIRPGFLVACNLNGMYDLSPLARVPALREARWAAFKRLVPELDLRAFRLPTRLIALVECAAQHAKNHYTRQELKNLICSQGEDAARICAQLAEQQALFDAIVQSSECLSLRALAVTGRDFPQLCGKDVGRLLQKLLAHVLLHPEDNDRQTLLRLAEKLEL